MNVTIGVFFCGECVWVVVDHPTQLICIWIFICQQTNTKDIAGQSANPILAFWWKYDRYRILCICNMTSFSGAEWDDSTLRPKWKKKTSSREVYKRNAWPRKFFLKERWKFSDIAIRRSSLNEYVFGTIVICIVEYFKATCMIVFQYLYCTVNV